MINTFSHIDLRRPEKYLRFYFVFLLTILAGISQAQTIHDNMARGDEVFDEGDYYSASLYYRDALLADTTRLKSASRYAEACRLFFNYKEAEKWYAYIVRHDDKNKFPEALFWMAMMQKSLGRYATAERNFREYTQINKGQKDELLNRARLEEDACGWAMGAIHDSLPVKIEHLGRLINTPYPDFGAIQLGDSALLFSSLRLNAPENEESLEPGTYLTKIYQVKIIPGGYTKPVPLPPYINEPGFHNANVCFTSDHKTFFFTRCEDERRPEMRCAIYMSRFRNGRWVKPTRLDDRINMSGYTSTQPMVARADKEDILYFVSDRPGGFGKKDIWYSIVKRTRLLDPVNLGPDINTPGDEITPFYDNNTRTLYFSSDWHKGFGGFDIFKTRGALTKWAPLVHLEYPINTGYNDLYYTIDETDSNAYLTSNRPGSFFIKSQTCCNDIFRVSWEEKKEPPQPPVEVKDTASPEVSVKKLLPLTLYFHNDEPDPASKTDTTSISYQACFDSYIQLKDKYSREYSKGLKGDEKEKAELDIDDFFEQNVMNGMTRLENFSALLKKDLDNGSEVRITIKGYTSPLNTSEYNKKLARRRIISLINYLREYQNGAIKKYIDNPSPNGGKFDILPEPIGKEQANPLVSDNPHDQRNSVYSRAAALERRIQILYYESDNQTVRARIAKQVQIKQQVKPTTVAFDDEFWDFGNLRTGTRVYHDFRFKNTGNAPLRLIAMETSCGCTIVDWPKEEIPTGGTAVIKVTFDTHSKLGEQTEAISVKANIPKGEKNLFIRANVR